jgi:hypothetical protein
MMFSDVLENATPVEELPADTEEFYDTLVRGLEEIGFFTACE